MTTNKTLKSMEEANGMEATTAVELTDLYSMLATLKVRGIAEDIQQQIAYLIERAGFDPEQWSNVSYWQL